MAYDTDRRLNYLDDEVTSRLGAINATGRGTISISDAATTGTATITAVNVARTMLRHMGATMNNDTNFIYAAMTRVDLTNTTTITASVGSGGGGSRTLTVGYEYTEFSA